MAVDIIARGLAGRADGKAITAYEYAKRAGYTGTEEEFAEDMGNSATNATNARESAEQAQEYAEQAERAFANKSVTYSELVALVNGGGLVAGMKYRITDYVTKINGVYDISAVAGQTAYAPYCKSAEHAFDLIVTAIDESTLDEHAVATQHEGDTYFANNDLEAWDIKYTIENDPTKYMWADATNGKGVIFHMKDEYGNEAGYDFKNLLFLAYALAGRDGYSGDLVYDAENQPKRYGSSYAFFDALYRYLASGSYNPPFDKYDFAVGANILGVIQFSEITDTFLSTFNAGLYYTFDVLASDLTTHTDGSLNNGSGRAVGNVIEPCTDVLYDFLNMPSLPMGLNCTIFENFDDGSSYNMVFNHICGNAYLNIFGDSCSGNDIGEYSHGNVFGNDCDSNIFGSNCSFNIFETECESNIFENGCGANTFGEYCVSNTFKNGCSSNIFGDSCNYNTFGDGCESNRFGNSCGSNIFGNGCGSNIFGGGCNYNTFGDSCGSNTFGDNCYSNIFEDNCNYNTFEDSCGSNTFGDSCTSNKFGTPNLLHNTLGKNVRFVLVSRRDIGGYGMYLHVCDSVQGDSMSARLQLYAESFTPASPSWEKWVGYNSQRVLKQWTPADLVQ